MGAYFIETWEGMEDDAVLGQDLHDLGVDDVLATSRVVEVDSVAETLALDASLVDDIALGRHFHQVCRLFPVHS